MRATFSPTVDLQPGTTLIEASAGTGKTYQITNLVLRLVAERGILVDELLVVTYTNAATAELRDRVRKRIVAAIRALETGEHGGDEVFELLGDCDPQERRERLERLRLAREDFDAAAISTIHGFCQTVLQMHAFESRVGFDLELIEDTRPLLEEIVDDFLTEALHGGDLADVRYLIDQCGFAREGLLSLARKVTGAMDAAIEPEPFDPPDDWAGQIEAAAQQWRDGGKQELIDAICAAKDAGRISGRTYGRTKSGNLYKPFRDRLADDEQLLHDWASPRDLADLRLTHREVRDKIEHGGDIDSAMLDTLSHLASLPKRVADGHRRRFIDYVRAELPARLLDRREQSFDDLLRRVAEGVAPREDTPLVRALRDRFSAALVDEFQDTDPVQWAIFDRVFGQAERDGEATHHLVLIGDPKQAIYAFRGADVYVYLDARDTADPGRQFTMRVNHRSDGRLVEAMNTLFRDHDRVLEHEQLDYIPVDYAKARNPWAGLRRPDDQPVVPLRIRWFDARAEVPDTTDIRVTRKADARRLVPALVAQDIVDLLEAGVEVGDGDDKRPAHAGDIAVLVRKNRQGEAVQAALRERGVLAIRSATGTVFDSEQATWIQRWLAAVTEPGHGGAARALAITPLFGWTASALLEAEQDGSTRWTEWLDQLATWSRAMDRYGFARTFSDVLQDPDTLERLASLPDAERRLTNYRHLVELLHAAETRDHLGSTGLARWLADHRTGEADTGEAAELRLESDARAVQIVTLHKSKGLQYPIVFLPYLWDGWLMPEAEKNHVQYHEHTDEGHELHIDARLDHKHPAKQAHLEQARQEIREENLRLLYVGVTRARHQVHVYWGPVGSNRSKSLGQSPLGAVLHGHRAGPGASRTQAAYDFLVDYISTEQQAPGPVGADLDELVDLASDVDDPPVIDWACLGAPGTTPVRPAVDMAPAPLADALRTFPTRPLAPLFKRLSYTSLTRGHHLAIDQPEAPIPPDREARDFDDTSAGSDVLPEPREPARGDDVPLYEFPRGPEPGIMIHEVLELLDFQTLREQGASGRDLPDLVRSLGRRMGVPGEAHHELLAAELPRILRAPLGPGAGGIALADLSTSDRLDELDFDLSLAGGDDHDGHTAVTEAAFKRAFCAPRPEGSPVPRAYLAAVEDPAFSLPPMAGFLTGSIDLVYRAGGRWYVCDYKSNRLGPRGRGAPSTWQHYAQPWMTAEMARHHYFIQYHLYTVALHRFLQARLPDYSYDRHMGGAVYLFVRGMGGPVDGGGVFTDRPPPAVIEALDRAFDGGTP